MNIRAGLAMVASLGATAAAETHEDCEGRRAGLLRAAASADGARREILLRAVPDCQVHAVVVAAAATKPAPVAVEPPASPAIFDLSIGVGAFSVSEEFPQTALAVGIYRRQDSGALLGFRVGGTAGLFHPDIESLAVAGLHYVAVSDTGRFVGITGGVGVVAAVADDRYFFGVGGGARAGTLIGSHLCVSLEALVYVRDEVIPDLALAVGYCANYQAR